MAQRTEHDVLTLLTEQHRQIKTLFARVRESTGAAKRDSFDDLVRLLAVHESAEEEIVHPMARSTNGQQEEVATERLDEESQAKEELARLYELGVDHADFDRKFAELERAVLEHAEREENDEFTALRAHTSAERLVTMAGALRVAEATAPTRPHPAAGKTAVGNLVAGPPIAVFDRARDLVRDWKKRNGSMALP